MGHDPMTYIPKEPGPPAAQGEAFGVSGLVVTCTGRDRDRQTRDGGRLRFGPCDGIGR